MTHDPLRLSGPSRMLPPVRPRRFRSLASRLVALGLLQLVLLSGTALAIFFVERPSPPAHPNEYFDPDAVHALEAIVDDRAALAAALDALRERRFEVSLYDAERHLIATNVDPALPVPDHDTGGGPEAHHRLVLDLNVPGGTGTLVARGVRGGPPSGTGPLLTLICGFVIVVIGALLTARWIVRPVERLSRTARALGSGDLAARSRLERSDEIGELGRRVDEMAERIVGLLATEKELLANVAHELRTPLTRIGVALDLAAEGDAEAARASLAEIAVDVSELETILDDILTAMRFEVARQLPLRRSIVEPSTIAASAVDRLRARHARRPVTLAVADALPKLDIDPVLVRRVLDNLLENAHKYTPDETQPIDVDVRRDGDRVIFTVRDRGVGISADDLPRVFTAFFRGDRSRSRETGGVGLGLTLAKRIVEAHGGTIELASTPGAGTTVEVAIPIAG
ncbi:MAG TPA: HAMP domain-containing sensor histidine kinase [Kofleriaceae bacterium]|nr:HAMP domain-containing sensor histidine kinase [Kofleriaceae bacterium]